MNKWIFVFKTVVFKRLKSIFYSICGCLLILLFWCLCVFKSNDCKCLCIFFLFVNLSGSVVVNISTLCLY